MQTQKLSTRAHYRRRGIRELDVFVVVGQRSLYLPPSNTNHVMCSAEQLTIGFALIRFNKTTHMGPNETSTVLFFIRRPTPSSSRSFRLLRLRSTTRCSELRRRLRLFFFVVIIADDFFAFRRCETCLLYVRMGP